MNKRNIIFVFIILLISLTGCFSSPVDNPPEEKPPEDTQIEEKNELVEIVFNYNDNKTSAKTEYRDKEDWPNDDEIKLKTSDLPTKDGSYFAGWYLDDKIFKQPFYGKLNKSQQANNKIELYAKWSDSEYSYLKWYLFITNKDTKLNYNDQIEYYKNSYSEHLSGNLPYWTSSKSKYLTFVGDNKIEYLYNDSYSQINASGTRINRNTKHNFTYEFGTMTIIDFDSLTKINKNIPTKNLKITSDFKSIDFSNVDLSFLSEKEMDDLNSAIDFALNDFKTILTTFHNQTDTEFLSEYHRITLDDNSPRRVFYYHPSEKIELPDTIKEKANHNFDGWYLDKQGIEKFNKEYIDKDYILYPKFIVQQRQVTYYGELEAVEDIIDIASGYYLTYILTADKKIYEWGFTHRSLAALSPSNFSKTHGTEVTQYFDLDADEEIEEVKMNYNLAAIRTSKNNFYLWGAIGDNLLGEIIKFETDQDKRIKSFEMSGLGLFVMYEDKGYNFYTYTYIYDDIESKIRFDNIDKVFGAENHIFVMGKNGEIYGFGDNNSQGKLGNGSYSLNFKSLTPYLNLQPGEKVIDIKGGEKHSILLTSNNRVFTFGDNKYDQLGISRVWESIEKTHTPIEITKEFSLSSNEKIIYIEASNNTSLAISNLGSVYVFGYENKIILHRIIKSGTVKDMKKFSMGISVMSSFGFFLTEDGQLENYGYLHGEYGNSRVYSYQTLDSYKKEVQAIKFQAYSFYATETYDYGSRINLLNPPKTGSNYWYTFGNSQAIGSSFIIYEDQHFFLNWEKESIYASQ